jgi:alpha-galactosidase
MLEVGNGGMTRVEYQAHFSLWAMLAAPLMAGNDLESMTAETRDILTNREVIAVDQDALGSQGKRARHEDGQDIWVKPLQDGGVAAVLLNRATTARTTAVNWTELGFPADKGAAVRDLWAHKDLGAFQRSYSATVEPHGVVMIRVRP